MAKEIHSPLEMERQTPREQPPTFNEIHTIPPPPGECGPNIPSIVQPLVDIMGISRLERSDLKDDVCVSIFHGSDFICEAPRRAFLAASSTYQEQYTKLGPDGIPKNDRGSRLRYQISTETHINPKHVHDLLVHWLLPNTKMDTAFPIHAKHQVYNTIELWYAAECLGLQPYVEHIFKRIYTILKHQVPSYECLDLIQKSSGVDGDAFLRATVSNLSFLRYKNKIEDPETFEQYLAKNHKMAKMMDSYERRLYDIKKQRDAVGKPGCQSERVTPRWDEPRMDKNINEEQENDTVGGSARTEEHQKGSRPEIGGNEVLSRRPSRSPRSQHPRHYDHCHINGSRDNYDDDEAAYKESNSFRSCGYDHYRGDAYAASDRFSSTARRHNRVWSAKRPLCRDVYRTTANGQHRGRSSNTKKTGCGFRAHSRTRESGNGAEDEVERVKIKKGKRKTRWDNNDEDGVRKYPRHKADCWRPSYN
ncbi:hypothetical protein P154DRAFT_576677 [Amniculicola lignicola CBS 123094]|uniref:BTB domain-containing protein n=1 Tax=Amniculicola lignicola CBS 123094 TaxID=1392246 RepID=A0A6A5WD35_9PLEO|nr:hypothetical protein P154DRAFT_576677 [Amniculicola lignicola CBS 123094]